MKEAMTEREHMHLRLCRQHIEKKLGWGSPEQWTQQDFVRLSERILEETGVSLSNTTLKRIWGRVKYESIPHVSTLNVLAQFVDYPHWRAFRMASPQAMQQPLQQTLPSAAPSYRRDKKVILKSFALMLLLGVAGTALLGLIFSQQDQQKASLASQQFSLTAQAVTTGLPNTVIFDYDASAATTDSIFIQTSEDPKHKAKVSRKGHQYSAMYYYPGAYQAELLADDEVVSTQHFLIKTKGWTALVEREPMPLYFEEDIIKEGRMSLSANTWEEARVEMHRNTPWVAYYNVGNFAELYNDNFTLETEVKHDFAGEEAVCKDSSIVILYQDAPPLNIPLSIPGCLAHTDKILQQQHMTAEETNLLAFGVDFSDWVRVRCEARDQDFRLHINEQLAYQGSLPQKSSRIVGIGYRFHGTGSVNYLSLGRSDGEEIYCEDFDQLL